MAELDLDRLSVLVVEDSPFIRSLLINSLKILGVGKVTPAEDGGRAIEIIQAVQRDPVRAGIMSIDLILSNWEMSPTNGMMLLRWVRRHKDSPDRFIPFIMITAYSDAKRVREAREMGVHEMMSKPFTITSLSQKLSSVILRNRQFVHTSSYFGPDRRRQKLPFEGPERRVLTDKSPEVEIIRA